MSSQMQLEVSVNVPEWFVADELHMLKTIVSPNAEEIGILMAGENLDATKRCRPTVRLYLMKLVNDRYEVTKELDAFQFKTTDEATKFSSKLPEINAIDLVLMLNREQPFFAV